MSAIALPFEPIDKRSLTREQFVEEYLLPQRPVVIAGGVERWPAWKKWSIDYFYSTYQTSEVPVRVFAEGKEWGKQSVKQMKFGDFIDEHIRQPWTGTGRAPLLDYSGFFRATPELKADIRLGDLCENYLERLPEDLRARHENLQYGWLLIGPQGAVYNLHCDYWAAHACIAHFEGRKRVVMYPPNQTSSVYNGAVDVDRPDLVKFPRFAKAKGRREGILEPGDLAFVPSRWWHQVTYLTACVSLNAFIVNQTNVAAYREHLGAAAQFEPASAPVFNDLIAALG